jgi:hypothetical protein
MTIEFSKAKKLIATLWFIGGAILFFLILVQTITGKFEDKIQEAWGWFLPLILPNLTLMIGVFANDIKTLSTQDVTVDNFYYRLTFALSFFYLLSILLIFLLQPIISFPIIELMHNSSIFLGPFQGLVSLSIGLFFVNKDKTHAG